MRVDFFEVFYFIDKATLMAYFLMVISTRRFFCRPSGLSLPSGLVFGANGFDSPQPLVTSCAPVTLLFSPSQRLTEAARFSESVRL